MASFNAFENEYRFTEKDFNSEYSESYCFIVL